MTYSPQPRIPSLTRCTAALALAAVSVTGLAQASVAVQAPATSTTSAPIIPQTAKHQRLEAEDAYLAGARLLDHKDLEAAEVQFEKATRLDPGNRDYQMASALALQNRVSSLVQQAAKARVLGQGTQSETLLAEARKLDPTNILVTQHADVAPLPIAFTPRSNPNQPALASLSSLAGPIVLSPSGGAQDFHQRADIQDVVRQVAGSYGIRTTFDESVIRQPIRFDLDNATYQQAIPIVLELGHLLAVPLDAKSILVAKDTPDNRQRFEPQLEETISIPGMTTEQMGELSNVVKNVFDLNTKQVSAQNNLGTLVIRAPESVLHAVNLTLADIVDGGSQVMFDLKLYDVEKNTTRNIGAQPPTQLGIYNVNAAATSLVNANQTLVNQGISEGLIPAGSSNIAIAIALIASGLVQSTLLSSTVGFFGGGTTMTGVTYAGSPTFNLALTSSETHTIDDVQLRIGDRQTATFRAGSRYPVTTSTYTAPSVSTSSLSGVSVNGVSASSLLASSTTTIPQIQYEDLGITLKATPTVQKSGVIGMHLELKIESLAGGSIDNIPILTSQQYSADTTVADGETATLVSSLSKSEALAISGLPGLAELPGFQSSTADENKQVSSGELVLLITPHLIRRRSNVVAGPRIAVDLHPVD
jgi:general secretion pathway protein D